ncbi:hypothetical protein K449DRAFT_121697 [Hypoxylon sp. EC38]|nr:hypothetical protein K449DRAFT_121697 [Hypoxylon sp. EC38]
MRQLSSAESQDRRRRQRTKLYQFHWKLGILVALTGALLSPLLNARLYRRAEHQDRHGNIAVTYRRLDFRRID